jgi:SAM-dependent methyltransferase
MSSPDSDKVFSGSVPQLYNTHLVPLIFEPYAADLVDRLASRALTRVLEVAAGTGVVTRTLASLLPERVSIVATDRNQPMLDHASALGTQRPVEWRQADALQLPFPDGAFDAVVCQFGVMFFSEKSKAFSEARRVLRPGGLFIFNVWDRIEENEFADTVTTALESVFPEDPPRFLARTPHGYYDRTAIERDLANGGFTKASRITTVEARSWAKSAQVSIFSSKDEPERGGGPWRRGVSFLRLDGEGKRIVVGAVEMWESRSDFQGRWETRETCCVVFLVFHRPSFPQPSPCFSARRFRARETGE